MRLTVLLPAVLRVEAGGLPRLEVTVQPGAHLGDLLDAIGRTHPRLERRIRDEQGGIRRYVNVYVDGEESRHVGGVGAPLRDGGEIHVIPSVAGG